MSLKGKIALVTGASRGIGRGIALQLGQAGATVYITGRQPENSDNKDGTLQEIPTLEKTAKEITERGGEGIAVYCDHGKDQEIEKLFEQIKNEQNGKLDILVNNAYGAINHLFESAGKKFWEYSPDAWDIYNNVGLRNHYVCSVYAARLMVPQRSGLIVTVSSPGGLQYLFNVPYGVGKAACDRLAADMAVELKDSGVTSVALWPGYVATEYVLHKFQSTPKDDPLAAEHKDQFTQGESPEYSGMVVAALASDAGKLSRTGKILLTADLGGEFGLRDIDGRVPQSLRSLKQVLEFTGWKSLAAWVPEWVNLPGWVLTAGTSKI